MRDLAPIHSFTRRLNEFPTSLTIDSWFSVALFFYGASYLCDLSSKSSRNVFYVLFAIPAVIVLVRAPRQTLRHMARSSCWALIALLITATSTELFSIEGTPADLLKQSFYFAILYVGLDRAAKAPTSLRLGLIFFGIASLIHFAIPLYEWASVYIASGLSTRAHPYELNLTRSSLLVTFGLISLWLFAVEPWIKTRPHRALGVVSLFILVLAICLVSVVFQSRLTLAALFLFLFLYGIMRKRYLEVLLSLAAALVITLTTGLYRVFLQRGISYRGAIWQDAFDRISSDCNWLLGCGSGGAHQFAGQFLNPHSGYVATVYYHGALTSVMLLVLIATSITSGIRNNSPYLMLSAVGWGGAIASSTGFITSPNPQWIYLWVPLILTLIPDSAADSRQPK